ncbi:MAG: ATP-binding cassette domain-containing protein [Pseudomonadota bacterium]
MRHDAGLAAPFRALSGRYAAVLVHAAGINLLALAVPLFVLQVYDRVIAQAGFATLQALLLGVVIAIVADLALRLARARLLQGAAVRLDVGLGRRLFDKLGRLGLERLEATSTASFQARFRDVEVVRTAASAQSAALLVDLPFVLLVLLGVAYVAAPVAPVLLAAAGGYVLLALASVLLVGAAADRERDAAHGRDGAVLGFLEARATVKALDLHAAGHTHFEEAQAAVVGASLVRGRRQDELATLTHGLSLLTTVGIVAVGALAVLDQRMTIGALVAANVLAGRLVQPLAQLVFQGRTLTQAVAAWRRLVAFDAADEDQAPAPLALPRPVGRLRAEALGFAYHGASAPVLENVGFSLAPGGLHVVTGANGSGKTTLLKLLQGLYAPTTGRVFVDDTDLAQLGRDTLVRWLGYAPQEPQLLGTTVTEAIRIADPDADDVRVLVAARRAGVDTWARQLPDGYATPIGEGGRRLSMGRRQSLALARVLLRDPPILLLDEPSAHLDAEAEARLLDELVALAERRTVLVVAHAPAFLERAASIMVLDQGRMVLAGPGGDVRVRLEASSRPAALAAVR